MENDKECERYISDDVGGVLTIMFRVILFYDISRVTEEEFL